MLQNEMETRPSTLNAVCRITRYAPNVHRKMWNSSHLDRSPADANVSQRFRAL